MKTKFGVTSDQVQNAMIFLLLGGDSLSYIHCEDFLKLCQSNRALAIQCSTAGTDANVIKNRCITYLRNFLWATG